MKPAPQDRKPTGIELVAQERVEQISKHGYDANHDAGHRSGELALAAVAYALLYLSKKRHEDRSPDAAESFTNIAKTFFPFEPKYLQDTDSPSQMLAKAGAFIAAEIDRLQMKD